jgi:DNA helicase-2/ATP-dependent DNA helicase PcrA
MFQMNNVLISIRTFMMVGQSRMVSNDSWKLEYADVFPLLYCKIRLEGVHTYDHVKHLLVDEMQDYTPVHYAVLSKVFQCRKTILGDVRQTVNPYSASAIETMERVFPQADVMKLYRSYRSTIEHCKLYTTDLS